MRWIVLFCCGMLWMNITHAQDSSFTFTAYTIGIGKTQIAWQNPFPNLIQVSVQKSVDSLKQFRTIFSSPSPELPSNGFIDAKGGTFPYFYRIFYVMEGGKYFFTPSVKAIPKPIERAYANIAIPLTPQQRQRDMVVTQDDAKPKSNRVEEIIITTIKTKDSIVAILYPPEFKQFKDSILRKTKDTLFTISQNELLLARFKPVEVFKPSTYVYTTKDDYLQIKLPASTKAYQVLFFTMKDEPLFSIAIPQNQTNLQLDKSPFRQAGWYKFELYEGTVLKEKHRFYLSKLF
jgi:hypothetical protein